MPKQLLIFESAVPVSPERHAGVCVESDERFVFSTAVNAVPLMAVEFARASPEYAIVFVAEGDDVVPRAVLGVRDAQNLYLLPDGRWNADYIPAFIRRYPFVFAAGADGSTFTLCLDETYPGVNRDGRGSALFGADGRRTPYVDKVLEFLQDLQLQYERTRAFGRRIKGLGLLEPMQASVPTPAGDKLTLRGFLAVDRERLRALGGDALAQLARNDDLELLYLHLASMRNFDKLRDRLAQPAQAHPAEPAAQVASAQASAPPQKKRTRVKRGSA